jgi:hypothetical protein
VVSLSIFNHESAQLGRLECFVSWLFRGEVGKFRDCQLKGGGGIERGRFCEFSHGIKHPVPVSKREGSKGKTLMLQ